MSNKFGVVKCSAWNADQCIMDDTQLCPFIGYLVCLPASHCLAEYIAEMDLSDIIVICETDISHKYFSAHITFYIIKPIFWVSIEKQEEKLHIYVYMEHLVFSL